MRHSLNRCRAGPDSEETVHNQIAHQRIRSHRDKPRMQWDRVWQINAVERSEGLKKEEQWQDRHLEKAFVRSVSGDPELRRAEEEHERKFVTYENDDGPRGSEK